MHTWHHVLKNSQLHINKIKYLHRRSPIYCSSRVIRSRQVKKTRRVAEATARGRLSVSSLPVAASQALLGVNRNHWRTRSCIETRPRRGRLHESLRQRSSKHFLSHRLRSQNPEIRGTPPTRAIDTFRTTETAQSGCSQVFTKSPCLLRRYACRSGVPSGRWWKLKRVT